MTLTKTVRRMVAGLLVLGAVVTAPQAAFAQMTPRVTDVQAFATDSWRVWVVAGYTYAVVVNGDGDTDLDLFVNDVYGSLGIDDDRTDYCVVRFRARTTGYIDIRVVNLGRVYNRYVIEVR
jgi:hypothetical protein